MTEKLLPFHVYRRAIFNTLADKRYCVASIFDGRAGSHQCSRKPKHQYGGHGWCAAHYPPNKEARREARNVAWQAKWDAHDAEAERRALLEAQKDAALDAIKKIAAGHNDPAALAREVLGMPT